MSTFTIYKAGVLSFCIAIVLLFACKKEKPDIMQPIDPCACASEVSAEFMIEEYTGQISNKWIPTDTTLHSKKVQFRALEENAEYTWYIGTEQFNTQAASRYFSDEWKGFNIPITLVVKKEPNKVCFPDDDGYDSITKYFHVSEYPIMPDLNDEDRTIHHAGIVGTYRMIGEEMSDSIDVEVHMELFGLSTRIVHIKNLDGEGTYCDFESLDGQAWRTVIHWAYREVKLGEVFARETFCKTLYGTIRNRIDGVAEMDFEIRISDYPNPPVTSYIHYLGRKIN
jgi:hypothetical protein